MIIDPVIYVIFNIINDKCYVGQAVVKNKRWKNHKIALRTNSHENQHLQSSYNKYGADVFVFMVLENLWSISDLDIREQYWMDKLKPEYNKNPQAGSAKGFKHSEETKLKWSKQRKGKKRSEEAKQNIKDGWKKRGPVSEQAKENMRKAQLGKKQSEATKIKKSWSLLGNKNNVGKIRSKSMSEDTKKKIGAANYAAHRRKNSSTPLDEI